MDYFQEHGDDLVSVKLIDLISAVTRIQQASEEGKIADDGSAATRLVTCDLPRLRGYLPVQALVEMSEAF